MGSLSEEERELLAALSDWEAALGTNQPSAALDMDGGSYFIKNGDGFFKALERRKTTDNPQADLELEAMLKLFDKIQNVSYLPPTLLDWNLAVCSLTHKYRKALVVMTQEEFPNLWIRSTCLTNFFYLYFRKNIF